MCPCKLNDKEDRTDNYYERMHEDLGIQSIQLVIRHPTSLSIAKPVCAPVVSAVGNECVIHPCTDFYIGCSQAFSLSIASTTQTQS